MLQRAEQRRSFNRNSVFAYAENEHLSPLRSNEHYHLGRFAPREAGRKAISKHCQLLIIGLIPFFLSLAFYEITGVDF
jgi:hypothetical protein